MKNSSLVEVLSGFSPTEWKALGQRAGVALQPRVAQLFQYLYQHISSPAHLQKETAFKTLYAAAPYDDQHMREDMTALYREVKDSVRENELRERPELYNYLLVSGLRKRNALRSSLRVIKKAENVPQKDLLQDEWHFLGETLMAQEKEQVFAQVHGRIADQGIQQQMDSLDRYYILTKLKLCCEQENRRQILKTDYHPILLEEILQLIDHSETLGHIAPIAVYRQVLLMLRNPTNETHFTTLMDLLGMHTTDFVPEELRNIYRYAQNYCIRMVNQGKTGYFNNLLDIYKRLLQQGLLTLSGEMDHTDYKNIVTTGLRQKEFAWTQKFLDDYQPLLPANVRDGAYLYNKANLLYETGQPNQAADLLVAQNFEDIFYNLSSRHLLLKIFYDQEEFEALTYQIESFRVYLGRNKKISPSNRDTNLNFLKVMRRLASAKQQQDYLKTTELQKRVTGIDAVINKYSPLANKTWLLGKLGELKVS